MKSRKTPKKFVYGTKKKKKKLNLNGNNRRKCV